MNALRVWLIHRLGGVDQPRTVSAREATGLAMVQTCLQRAYGGTWPGIGSFTSTSDVGSETHIRCTCSRCRKAA